LASDLRVVLPNRPGALTQALDALCRADINIESFCGDIRPGERWGFLHLLVHDAPAARRALDAEGFEVTSEHDVDVVPVTADEPGGLAEAVRRYSDDNRNIEVLYTAGDGNVVIGTEDMQKPRFGVRMEDAKY
jgi:hypothetical protein